MTPINGSSPHANISRLKTGIVVCAGLTFATSSCTSTGDLSKFRLAYASEESLSVKAESIPASEELAVKPELAPAKALSEAADPDESSADQAAPQVLTTATNLFEHADVDLTSKGLTITSEDGSATFRVGGRIQIDTALHSRDSVAGDEITDGNELRRGRFFIAGKQEGGWLWSGEIDFASSSNIVRDFWLAHEDANKQRITVGNQKQPFSLGLEMSSNDLPFVERGIDNFLIVAFVDRAIGLRVDTPTENSLFSFGLYGESLFEPGGSAQEDEGYGATARYVYSPITTDDEVLHLAVRAAVRAPSSNDGVQIRTESTNQSNFRIQDTGTITDVQETYLYGFETVYAAGPWSLGGEYNLVDIDRSGEDLQFTSWHVEGTYSLTGESRAGAYKIGAGEFKRLKQETTGINPFDGGGAWEAVARFANLDLNDPFIRAGEANALSLGINWYANTNVRFLFDWTRILNTSGGDAVTEGSDDLDIFTFRAQLLF